MDQKRGRGRPRKELETKTVSLSVSPQAWEDLEARAVQMGYSSRSALVEAIAVGKVELSQVANLGELCAS